MFSHSKLSDSLPSRSIRKKSNFRFLSTLPTRWFISSCFQAKGEGREKSDFIVKHSPTKTRKSSHRKFVHRKFAQHSFAFLPSFPSPAVMFVFSSIFHATKKGYNELKGKILYWFSAWCCFIASTSIHLSQYSAQINHFYAVGGWSTKEEKLESLIFLLEICLSIDSRRLRREIVKIW